MGENHSASLPRRLTAWSCDAAVAYTILQRAISVITGRIRAGPRLGSDSKGKLSLALYVTAIPLAFVNSGCRCNLCRRRADVAHPGPRIERHVHS